MDPGPAAGTDELVDVDGAGFPDLLHAETGAHGYQLNQGGLCFDPRLAMPWSPSLALSANGVEVADLDGDGLPDLVARSGADFRATSRTWVTDPCTARDPPRARDSERGRAMTSLRRTYSDLPDWTFEIDEVSAGVYRVKGTDDAGRSVEATGTDPDVLLDDCKRSAARIRGEGR